MYAPVLLVDASIQKMNDTGWVKAPSRKLLYPTVPACPRRLTFAHTVLRAPCTNMRIRTILTIIQIECTTICSGPLPVTQSTNIGLFLPSSFGSELTEFWLRLQDVDNVAQTWGSWGRTKKVGVKATTIPEGGGPQAQHLTPDASVLAPR